MGLLKTRITQHELYGAILCCISAVCLFCFLKSPQLVELLKRMLQHCFAGKLQKCFGDFKTSPGFPPSKETTFHFWVNISLDAVDSIFISTNHLVNKMSKLSNTAYTLPFNSNPKSLDQCIKCKDYMKVTFKDIES